jgi:hypothetical protein
VTTIHLVAPVNFQSATPVSELSNTGSSIPIVPAIGIGVGLAIAGAIALRLSRKGEHQRG